MKNMEIKYSFASVLVMVMGLVMAGNLNAGNAAVKIDVVESGHNDPVSVLYTGRHYEYRIWISNDFRVDGMTMGFRISCGAGVIWQWESQPDGWGTGQFITAIPGSRLEDPEGVFDLSTGLIVDEGYLPHRIFFGGGIGQSGDGLEPGPLQPMISLHFKVTSPTSQMCIDSVFIPPYGDFVFSDMSGHAVWPQIMWDPEGVCLPVEEEPYGLTINSTCDPAFTVCPGGDAQFRIFLRDEWNYPIVGDSTSAWVEFESCGTIQNCPSWPRPFTTIHPAGPTDNNGMMSFYMAGGRCDNACVAKVRTADGLLATVPVRSFDINGDLAVSVKNDFNFSQCNDYNGNGTVNFNDANLFNPHAGHQCDIDPCRQFGFEFRLNPESNLQPSQIVDLELRVANNSQAVCTLGVLGFFASAYGAGGLEELIESRYLDSILAPGQEVFVTVPYMIPVTGHGCVLARFTPSCCDSVVTLIRCFQSIQLCRPDSNICYEVQIVLNRLPIPDTSWFVSLPNAGWSMWPIHTPSFPLYTTDTLVYQICTPNLTDLGDSASVIFRACYDGACNDFQAFENRIVLSSTSGDVNADCTVNVGDAVYLINYIFKGGPAPVVAVAGDPNCDAAVNVGDAVHIINYIFKGGAAPCFVE